MKKLLIVSLLLSCSASIIKPMELSEKQQKQLTIPADAECFICHEDAKSISDQKGPGFLRKTSCCKQFLCGSCNNELGIRNIKQCPHCRKDGFNTISAALEVEKRIEPVAQQNNENFFIPEVQSQEELEKLIQEQLKIEADIELRKKQEAFNKSQDKRLVDSRQGQNLKNYVAQIAKRKKEKDPIEARQDEERRIRDEERRIRALRVLRLEFNSDQKKAPVAQKPVVNGNQAHFEDILYFALKEGSEDLVQELIKNGYDITQMKPRAWQEAIHGASGYLTKLKIILNNGANPNQILIDGRTPLIIAIESGRPYLVLALLVAGANPNQKARINNVEHTPLSYAASRGEDEMIEILIENGANLYANL